MTFLVSIDPGVSASNATGVAIWRDDGSMLDCALVRPKPKTRLEERVRGIVAHTRVYLIAHTGIETWQVVLEIPRVYHGKGKGDLNDLIDVATLVGGLATLGSSTHFVTPSEWKGQAPKDVTARRVLERLTPAERELFNDCDGPDGLKHNVLDAIGIGLWKVGRWLR